jgi:hypothetical protein
MGLRLLFSSVLQTIVVTRSTLQTAQKQRNATQTPQFFATLSMFPNYSRSNYHTGERVRVSSFGRHAKIIYLQGYLIHINRGHAYSKLLHFKSPRNDRLHRDNLEERSKCRHYTYYFYRTHDRKDQT